MKLTNALVVKLVDTKDLKLSKFRFFNERDISTII